MQRNQADVKAAALLLDTAVNRPGCTLSQADLDAWHSLRDRCYAYAAEDAPLFFTASALDSGQALQAELAPWYDKLRAAGCDPGPTPPKPAGPAPLFSFLGELPPVAMLLLAYLLVREFRK